MNVDFITGLPELRRNLLAVGYPTALIDRFEGLIIRKIVFGELESKDDKNWVIAFCLHCLGPDVAVEWLSDA
jgi:hypothetical protein